MKAYNILFSYSKNGKNWTTMSTIVRSESDRGAMEQVRARYPYVRNMRIVSVR